MMRSHVKGLCEVLGMSPQRAWEEVHGARVQDPPFPGLEQASGRRLWQVEQMLEERIRQRDERAAMRYEQLDERAKQELFEDLLR